MNEYTFETMTGGKLVEEAETEDAALMAIIEAANRRGYGVRTIDVRIAGRDFVCYLDLVDNPDEGTEDDVVFRVAADREVCPNCEGKGTQVNPEVDGHGISAEEFAADPDFRRDYLAGVFDIACLRCGGQRIVLVPRKDEEHSERLFRLYEEAAHFAAEEAAERRAGC